MRAEADDLGGAQEPRIVAHHLRIRTQQRGVLGIDARDRNDARPRFRQAEACDQRPRGRRGEDQHRVVLPVPEQLTQAVDRVAVDFVDQHAPVPAGDPVIETTRRHLDAHPLLLQRSARGLG